MRYAARTDANQREVVEALRAAGCTVRVCSSVGGGFPDLLVAASGTLWLVEVKDGSKRPSERKLTPKEREFQQQFAPWYVVVESPQDALRAVGVLASPPDGPAAPP